MTLPGAALPMTILESSLGQKTTGPERLMVTADGTTVVGMLRPGTQLARIVAVDGPAPAAIDAFVAAAAARGCVAVRAEVAAGDAAEAALAQAGFRAVGPAVHAHQPTRPVLRLERRIGAMRPARTLPYYSQTTWFTCGPVALMLAGARVGGAVAVDRRSELALWREATTVHAPGGPGGCEPFGIACAAARRGLKTSVISTIEGPFLMDRAADADKRELMLFVQAEFRTEASERGVAVEIREWTHRDLGTALADGGVAIVLIDQIVFQGHPMPHWILVHGADGGTYWIDDPWVDVEAGETDTDKFDVPVPAAELDRMAWWGASPYRVAVLLEPV